MQASPPSIAGLQIEIEECDIGESMTPIDSGSPNPLFSSPPTASPIPRPRPGSFHSPASPNAKQDFLAPSLTHTRSRSKTLPRGVDITKVLAERNAFELDSVILAKMQKWVLAFAIVDFDLDVGPVISGIHPTVPLSPAESANIAFSSFPDSLQFDQGSQLHSFRFRDTYSLESSEIPPERRRPRSTDGFIYAFSHFTQRRDTSSKRGYQQRSLVLLTYNQYPSLYTAVLQIIGPLYQTHGITMLEAACQNVASWLDPVPGKAFELGLLGTVFQVELPQSVDSQQFLETSSFPKVSNLEAHIFASSAPLSPPPLALFEASVVHLWSIWECLVLCEPILVFGASPAATSQAIWWFRDLLRPIPLANDIRPYFTIHDKDHADLVNKMPPKAGLVMGVTNPFFERSCEHWPHVLSLGATPSGKTSRDNSPANVIAGPAPGWKTKTHKRYISKDRGLLKQLEDACRGSDATKMKASLALRQHFHSRSTALLVPLARYLQTLIPPPSELSGLTHTRRLKPFNQTAFFASLKLHGSPLPFKSSGKQKEFYERWLKSPAFGLWLGCQEEVVRGVLTDGS